jgi:tRNA and rRNA cytosine-C5-methylases
MVLSTGRCLLPRFMLQPGCELAYITCTLRTQENEKQIQKVMRNAPGLQLVRQWQTPHEHPWLEGMFGAVLRKQT